MGGGGKKQTVGYKYFVGMHMILCHGPVDSCQEIRVDDRVAWSGIVEDGTITINKPSLFGGESREGGVSGTVDFESGGPTQEANAYLESKLPNGLIPAFRRVTAAVLRQVYIGVNPYLKAWKFKLQRIMLTSDGAEQWYPGKAPIGALVGESVALYFALDVSGSMGGTKLANLKTAMSTVLDEIAYFLNASIRVDIMICAFSGTAATYEKDDADADDIDDLKTWVNGLSAGGTTNYEVAVAAAPAFFASAPEELTPISIFLTDGNPEAGDTDAASASLLGISGLSAYAFNIDLEDTTETAKMDNTPIDGVPVLSGGDADEMAEAIRLAIGGQIDMNPAHIIRECLTDPMWGMGYPTSDIDDTSFTSAADALYNEGFGLSIRWTGQSTIEDFVGEIIRHIDAALYVDRTTGKFALRLIRDDYDEESIVELGPDEIINVENYSRPALGDLVNAVTVNYEDYLGNAASVPAHDPALVQLQGAVVGTTIKYQGISNQRMAARVAYRDLRALSIPLLSCTIYANRAAAVLSIGDVFKFSFPDYHDDYIIMRVVGMGFGDGRTNVVRVDCVQDVFSLADSGLVEEPNFEWEDPRQIPDPSPYDVVVEAPYYELVVSEGQTAIDASLEDNPDMAYWLASSVRPSVAAINAGLYVNSGAGYEDRGVVDFSPSAVLTAALDYLDTTLYYEDGQDLDQIVVGSFAQIDDELVRVDAVDEVAGTITIGRGVLDTIPATHDIGAYFVAWDGYANSDQIEYATSETVYVKILPASGAGVVDIADATERSVTMDQRAYRPYPPGNLKFNDEYFPDDTESGDIVLTWAHRDRTQQTSGTLYDFTDGNIGPETDSTYTIRIYGDDVLVRTVTGETGTTWTYTQAMMFTDGGPFVHIKFEVETTRDGVASYQPYSHTIEYLGQGYGYDYGNDYGGAG